MKITNALIRAAHLDVFYCHRTLDGMYWIAGDRVRVSCNGGYDLNEIEAIRKDMQTIQSAYDKGLFAGDLNTEHEVCAALDLASGAVNDAHDSPETSRESWDEVNSASNVASSAADTLIATDKGITWSELLAQVRAFGFSLGRKDDEYVLTRKSGRKVVATLRSNDREAILTAACNWASA